MQGILFSNIKEEEFLIRVIRTFSKMNHYAPTRFYSTFKQFRLHVAFSFPEWNFTFFDNRMHHASDDFVPFRSLNKEKEK